jgi:hypothetical protein
MTVAARRQECGLRTRCRVSHVRLRRSAAREPVTVVSWQRATGPIVGLRIMLVGERQQSRS